jgi:hypothetical protein
MAEIGSFDPNKLQQDCDEIARKTGWALSAWTQIEFQIAHLFSRISYIPNEEQSLAIMKTIISLDTRIDVVITLIDKSHLQNDLKPLLIRLLNKIKKQSKRRNYIAHFAIINVMEFTEGMQWVAALIPFANPSLIYEGFPTKLNAKDIEEMRVRWLNIASCLEWFVKILSSDPETPKEHIPPEHELVTELRNSENQSREGR